MKFLIGVVIFLLDVCMGVLIAYVLMKLIIPQNKYTLLAGKYVEPFLAPVRALIAKLGELQIQHVRELATLIGVMYDKAALAMGDPTSNIVGDAFRVQIEVLDE